MSHPTERPRPSRPFYAPLLTALLLSVLAVSPVAGQGPGDGTLQIHYLNVGQGDAAVAITPNGVVVGFDAGPSSACGAVIDAYDELGITAIDYLVVSHYHEDHIGCVPELIDEFPVTEMVLDRRGRYSTQTFKAYKRAVGKKRKKARPGRTIALDKQNRSGADPVELDVIAVNGRAKGGKVAVPTSDQNDRGLVVRLRMGEFEALFGGDVSGTNESGHKDIESLVGPRVGDIEVYKVHHHGSRYSTSEEFLEQIKPKAAILSVGKGNQYDHPTRETLNRLRENRKLRTYWTTRGGGANPKRRLDRVCGDITVTVEPGAGEFTVNCPGRRKTETFATTTDDDDGGGDGGGGGGGGGGGNDDQAPGIPRNLSANVSGTSVTLSWLAPSSGGAADSYLLQVGTSPGGSNTFNGEVFGLSRSLSGLSNATYYARVRARNSAGTSPYTSNVSFVISSGGGGGGVPKMSMTIDIGGSPEIVTIRNESGSTVDMTGWKLVSVVGPQTFNFPAGTKVGPGATIRVTSGSGAFSNANTLKWTGSFIWNNDGDTGRLLDDQGRLVAQFTGSG